MSEIDFFVNWKKHLEEHFEELYVNWVEVQNACTEKEFKEFKKTIIEYLEVDPMTLEDPSYCITDREEMIRLLELCEATDNWRSPMFADNCVNDKSVVHIPLMFEDIQLIHMALHKYVDSELDGIGAELRQKTEAKKDAKKKGKN